MRFFRAFRPAAVALAALVAAAPSASAAAPPPIGPLVALPAKMMAALIADDEATLRATCAPSSTVIDEFAPYSWSGPDACVTWAAAFKVFAAKMKMSGFKGSVAPKPFIDVSGNRAYVVAKVTFGAMMAGKPMSEQGTWTVVAMKSDGAWKITSLAWGTLHH